MISSSGGPMEVERHPLHPMLTSIKPRAVRSVEIAVPWPGMTWEHFEHGADIGVRGIGATRAEAYAEAALALTAVITDPASVATEVAVDIECAAPDDELLLADWLNAITYEMATRGMLFGRFAVTLADHRLIGKAWGEPVDRARHHPAVEVKGATYTALAIAQRADGRWLAQCVVDV